MPFYTHHSSGEDTSLFVLSGDAFHTPNRSGGGVNLFLMSRDAFHTHNRSGGDTSLFLMSRDAFLHKSSLRRGHKLVVNVWGCLSHT